MVARRSLGRQFGRYKVMLTAGTLRACFSVGLAFIGPGVAGLVLVMAIELGLITSAGVFNPVYATYRLDQTRPTAWLAPCRRGRSPATPPSRP